MESKHPGSELLGVKHKQKENPWIVDRQFLSAAVKHKQKENPRIVDRQFLSAALKRG